MVERSPRSFVIFSRQKPHTTQFCRPVCSQNGGLTFHSTLHICRCLPARAAATKSRISQKNKPRIWLWCKTISHSQHRNTFHGFVRRQKRNDVSAKSNQTLPRPLMKTSLSKLRRPRRSSLPRGVLGRARPGVVSSPCAGKHSNIVVPRLPLAWAAWATLT